YLKKSIEERREQEEVVEEAIDFEMDPMGEGDEEIGTKYFEYNVYDYCKLPEEMISMIVDEKDDGVEGTFEGDDSELNIMLTSYCRRMLLDPIIAILEKQSAPLQGVSSFEIYGDVFFPGKYPTTINNQSLREAINAAGGLTKSSYLEEVEVTSKNYSGKELVSKTKEVSFKNPDSILIKNMDVLNIKTLADSIKFVEIGGEVFFPGVYPFQDKENIVDLIERAGGLKSTASLSDAIFQRKEIAENKKDRLKQIQRELRRDVLLMQSENSIGKGEDSIDVASINQVLEEDFMEEQTIGLLGRLIIDLPRMINDPSSAIMLEDGDSLIIPKERSTITVIGEVFGASTHQYDDGLTVEDYINLSGGVTEFADLSKSYIIKSNGSIMPLSGGPSSGFFKSRSLELMPGDSIVVPVRVDQFSTIKAASEVTKIIYEMAVAAAAISSFSN
ncbi:SLBB domain-containing protein, partial [Gammaproteobacteria bacterium]|nr:SLBB domain-containing protein [Gammaproteobacteria bacterium]